MSAAKDHHKYERAFRSLLWRLRPERLHEEVKRCLTAPLQIAYERTRVEVIEKLLVDERRRAVVESAIPTSPVEGSPDFHCDAGAGGVARWLRAAGYDAAFWPGIADELLVRKVIDSSAILITADRRLMDRGAITMGCVPALLVSNEVKKRDQFASVMSALDLPVKTARCMECGGELRPVAKTDVRERIPPRTYPWRDDYLLCARCDKLYWEGSHWEGIGENLSKSAR